MYEIDLSKIEMNKAVKSIIKAKYNTNKQNAELII